MPRAQRALPVRATPRAPVEPTTSNERAMGALSRSGVTKQAKAPDRALSTQVNLLGRHFGLFAVRSRADEFLWNIKGSNTRLFN
jgi:hypothetical protein